MPFAKVDAKGVHPRFGKVTWNAKSSENVQTVLITSRIIHFWILFYLNSTTDLICVSVSNIAVLEMLTQINSVVEFK